MGASLYTSGSSEKPENCESARFKASRGRIRLTKIVDHFVGTTSERVSRELDIDLGDALGYWEDSGRIVEEIDD